VEPDSNPSVRPTNQAAVAEKDRFYTSLQQVFSQVPKQDVVILSGDFNAKIGERPPIGEFALGVRNDNGERLVQFAEMNGLVAANAMRRQHPRHQYTWCAPDGKCRNQIDYILLSKRWLSSVGKCKTCPGADADTDHVVVRMEFKLKLHKLPKKKSTPRYDFSEKERFQLELQNRYQLLDIPGAADPENVTEAEKSEQEPSAQTEWLRLKGALTQAAAKTLRKQTRTKKQEWIKPETFALIEEKRRCPRQDPRKRQVRSRLRSDRHDYLINICQETEDHERMNRSKDLYETVNRFTKKICPKVSVITDKEGTTLTEKEDVLDRWREYCETLFSDTDNVQYEGGPGQEEPAPLIEEVERAFKSMRGGKAAGPDEIPVELLKLGDYTVVKALHRIILCVWKTGKWPEDWTQSTFVPLYKKGDPTVCANYRTISLVSHASKVLLKILLERIKLHTEFEVAEEQAGFRPKRGTHNHLCNLRILTESARARRQPLHLCFVDFEKAFDRVNHGKLWKAMRDMGFAEHIIDLIRSLYASQRSNVRVCGDTSEWFKVRRGVRQGCILSPYLFNLMGELLMRCALEGYRGGFRIGGRLVTNLRYADDIVLVASSEEELQDLVNCVNLAANDLDMRINMKKTEVMKICDDLSPMRVTVAGYPLSETKSFKYLGAMFNAEALCDKEVRTRLARARGRMGELVPLWRSSTVSNKLKARLIKTLVWPIAT